MGLDNGHAGLACRVNRDGSCQEIVLAQIGPDRGLKRCRPLRCLRKSAQAGSDAHAIRTDPTRMDPGIMTGNRISRRGRDLQGELTVRGFGHGRIPLAHRRDPHCF